MPLPPETFRPEAFDKAFQDNYLGSPTVVEKILEGFIQEFYGWVQLRRAGLMTAEVMTEKLHESGKRFADIFSGQNPNYEPVVGWNARMVGLKQYIKADLGSYWQEQRADWDDDPLGVCYMWIMWGISEALKKDTDEEEAQAAAKHIQFAVKMLTGTLKRR